MYLTDLSSSHGPGSTLGYGEEFQGIFPGWSHALPCTQVWEDQRPEPQPKQWSSAYLGQCLQPHDDHEMPMDQT